MPNILSKFFKALLAKERFSSVINKRTSNNRRIKFERIIFCFTFTRDLTACFASVFFMLSKLRVRDIFGQNVCILDRKIMENEKASLNYDCNYNLFLAKRLIGDMKRIQSKTSHFIISYSINILKYA